MNSCFFNPNLGKSSWPPRDPEGPGQSLVAVYRWKLLTTGETSGQEGEPGGAGQGRLDLGTENRAWVSTVLHGHV